MKKKKLRHLSNTSWRIIVIIFIIVVGTATLLLTKAAQPTASLEAEAGTVSGNVSKNLTDSQASNSGSVKFGSSSTINRFLAQGPFYGMAVYWPNAGVNYQTSFNTHVQRVGNKKPSMLRTFGSSNNGIWNWNNIGDVNVSGHNSGNWHSFKIDFQAASSGSQNSAWTNSIKTIPVNGRPKLITIHHEPENDVPSSNPDAWILNWVKSQVEIGKAVKAANHPDVVFGPIFMSKYYVTGTAQTNPRNVHYFMKVARDNNLLDDLNSVYDFVGWDPYHEGSAESPPRLTAPRDNAKFYFDDLFAFNGQYFSGKPFAIGETGFWATHTDALRLAWLKTVKQWADNHQGDVLAICYYDASLTEPWYLTLGPGGTLSESYQVQSAQYWGSLY